MLDEFIDKEGEKSNEILKRFTILSDDTSGLIKKSKGLKKVNKLGIGI